MECAEVAAFGADRLIFVGSERGSLVGVYKDEGAGNAPTLLQALPGGIGPKGLLAIPSRNLLVTASENDLREDGLIGSVITIYERAEGAVAYPTIVSADDANPEVYRLSPAIHCDVSMKQFLLAYDSFLIRASRSSPAGQHKKKRHPLSGAASTSKPD